MSNNPDDKYAEQRRFQLFMNSVGGIGGYLQMRDYAPELYRVAVTAFDLKLDDSATDDERQESQ